MIILLRDEIVDGPLADINADVLKGITRAEFFPDRVDIVYCNEHDSIEVTRDGDFSFHDVIYQFCIVYGDELYDSLMQDYNLL